MNYFFLINLFAFFFILLGFIEFLIIVIGNFFNTKKLVKKSIKSHPQIAILIPARDESSVIEGLIESIEKQSIKINMPNVYIIVEDKKDKTCTIAKEHNCSIIVRKKDGISQKGYALDEAIKAIINKNKKYDLYFVFDADNILEKNFIEKMLPLYHQGYDIASSRRIIKNQKRNLISLCSTLTFSLVNGICNEIKGKQSGNVTITGTGYFIKGTIIEKWKGFPFTTLTEDYELSLYSILHNLSTVYNKNAIFYDEQPNKYTISKKQRVRWIKGYIDARKKYIPQIRKKIHEKSTNMGSKIQESIGLWPLVTILIGIIILLINNFIAFLYFSSNFEENALSYFSVIPIIFTACYIILSILTTILIEYDNQFLKITLLERIEILLFHPLFLLSYIPCALNALFQKQITWEKIEHLCTANE